MVTSSHATHPHSTLRDGVQEVVAFSHLGQWHLHTLQLLGSMHSPGGSAHLVRHSLDTERPGDLAKDYSFADHCAARRQPAEYPSALPVRQCGRPILRVQAERAPLQDPR